MSSLSEKVISKIKQEHITPDPRWKFLLRDYTFWGAFGFSILLGGISTGVMIFMISDSDWDIYRYTSRGLFSYVLLSIPYFWLLFSLGFLGVAFYNYQHTKEGYRYNPYGIWGLSIVSSLVLGMIFFYAGLGKSIEKVFASSVPYYQKVMMHRFGPWNQPEAGLLAGTVKDIRGMQMQIEDIEGMIWQVETEEPLELERNLRLGEKIKLMGQKRDKIFVVREIRKPACENPPCKIKCGCPDESREKGKGICSER